MVTILTVLPTELLRLILSSLADVDLRSLFAARRTCKTFQALLTDINRQRSLFFRPCVPHFSLFHSPRQLCAYSPASPLLWRMGFLRAGPRTPLGVRSQDSRQVASAGGKLATSPANIGYRAHDSTIAGSLQGARCPPQFHR